jgi:Flp pilus assembly protein TadD
MKRLASCLFTAVYLLLQGCASMSEKTKTDIDLPLMHREAQSAFEEGDDVRAEFLYQRLTTLGKQDAETWLRLGNIYARTNKPQLATEAYRTSLQINDSDPRTWNNLGIVLLRQSWVALIQANTLSNANDPAYLNSAEIIQALERLPVIQGEKAK